MIRNKPPGRRVLDSMKNATIVWINRLEELGTEADDLHKAMKISETEFAEVLNILEVAFVIKEQL